MKNWLKFSIAILLCLTIAVVAYFWATAMIDSNYTYRSVLKDDPPAPGLPLGEPGTERVVMVLIDALRYDTSLKPEVMPVLNSLRQQGASARMYSQPPSFSEPGYATLLTGAWPEINDGPVFNLEYDEIHAFTQDNLFSAAKRKGLITAISGYYWFEKLVPQDDVDFSFYTPGEDATADREVVDAALEWLEGEKAQLILIHIDQVDYAGHHEGGAVSTNWDAAANRADDLLSEILAKMDLTRQTLVVLSDHGQINSGGHGGNDPITLVEPFVIAGKGVKSGNNSVIFMVDVAPTLAALLGTNLPASTQGKVLTELLELDQTVLASLPSATREQQSNLVSKYSSAMKVKSSLEIPQSANVEEYQAVISAERAKRLLKDRIWRSAVVAVMLAVLVTILLRNRKQGSANWIVTSLITSVIFHLRYTLLDRRAYSISSITGETELISYVGLTIAAAFMLAWLLHATSQGVFKLIPSQSAWLTFNIGLTTVFILSLPVFLSFILNGAVVTWTLPEYTTSFFALLGLIQVLVISLITPLLAGVTALILWITRARPARMEP